MQNTMEMQKPNTAGSQAMLGQWFCVLTVASTWVGILLQLTKGLYLKLFGDFDEHNCEAANPCRTCNGQFYEGFLIAGAFSLAGTSFHIHTSKLTLPTVANTFNHIDDILAQTYAVNQP